MQGELQGARLDTKQEGVAIHKLLKLSAVGGDVVRELGYQWREVRDAFPLAKETMAQAVRLVVQTASTHWFKPEWNLKGQEDSARVDLIVEVSENDRQRLGLVEYKHS